MRSGLKNDSVYYARYMKEELLKEQRLYVKCHHIHGGIFLFFHFLSSHTWWPFWLPDAKYHHILGVYNYTIPSDTWWYFRMIHANDCRSSFFLPLFFHHICGGNMAWQQVMFHPVCGGTYTFLFFSFSIKKWRKKEWDWSRNFFAPLVWKNIWTIDVRSIQYASWKMKTKKKTAFLPVFFFYLPCFFEDAAYDSGKCRGFGSCTHRLRAKCYDLKWVEAAGAMIQSVLGGKSRKWKERNLSSLTGFLFFGNWKDKESRGNGNHSMNAVANLLAMLKR